VAEQGSPPPRPGRLPTAGRRGDPRPADRRYWDESAGADEADEEYPPWAGPGVTPRWADRDARQRRAPARQQAGSRGSPARSDAGTTAGTWQDDRPGASDREPGSRSRRAAARSRRRSRITWVWAGAVVAVVLIVAAVVVKLTGHQAAPVSHDGFVTTFQHGEFKTVPSS